EALSLSLRLKEQRVQHYWDEPLTNLGHIRDIGFGDVKGNPIDEIIIGTDEGEFIALDINNEKKELWASRGQAGSSVISLSTNNPHPAKGYETTLAALENGEISYIDNEGRDIDLPAHLLEAGERVTSLYVETSFVEGVHQLAHIALGLESQQICLYNAVQGQRQVMIPTAANTAMLYIGDILGQKRLDILTATVEHTVVLYTQDQQDPAHYTECWHYQTEDHIRGLRAVDIDRDGHVEIIIGSEDRNLYVLNHLGELKWRYFMPDGVFSVDVCKLNHDDQEYEILAGVDDGFIYILNSQGDLLLQIPVGDRVRVVRAKDLHPRDSQDSRHRYLPDNMVEIAVATDDRLLLFQILPLATIRELIEQSWFFVGNNIEPRELLYTYSDYQKQPDEYVRAFAIERIAGQRTHTDEDFKHLRTAVAKDPSLLVAQKLANAIVNLCRTSSNKREMRQSHQLLQQLARKPQRETRITIINVLDELALVNKRLSFEYLKRFLRNEDLWLRRMVIRQLHCLVKLDPAQVFSMLMTSTRDKNLWILQETGRSLASYFDYRHEHSAAADGDSDPAIYQGRTLLQDLHELLSTALDVTISKQIAISSKEPAIKQFFSAYARFQQAIFTRLPRSRLDNSLESLRQEERFKLFQEQKKGYQDDLTAFISALQDMLQIMPQIEDMLVVYQELLNVLQVTSIESIEQLRRKTESAEMYAFSHFKDIDATLVRMLEVVDEIKRYRKRQALGDQAATLLVAINLLSQIRQQYIEGRSVHSTQELLPEDALFRIALQQWYALLQKELRKLSGAARLSIELVPNEVQRDETVELSFNLTNTGKSAADAVRVTIPERSSDYEVIGSVERTLPEVSTLRAQTVSFILKPLAESFRLSTEVTYNDAEKRDRVQRQPHYINLKPVRAEFKTIVNPYHGGTPTSDSKMFYGREEDLNSLRDILGSTNARANRVILLIGQRRSGKTSLIYQLANQLQMHIAVHIDLQDLAMSNGAAELFSNFALKIQEAMFLRGFTPPPLNEFNFRENSTQTFDRYLKLSTQQLGGQRLILLFDEFEVFNELIQQKRLDENFLHYLRSLMQHRLGVNFLLAGAPHVLLYDINNRSALLNIAQKHHLSRLKEEEAAHLITDPVQNLVYDPQALELIHQLTGDQPYLIHLLCEELIYYCNKYKKNYANTNDINKIVDKVLERGDNYFWMIWKLASSREERLILTLLAGEADAGQGGIFSLVDLKKAFDDLNCSCDAEKMRQALSHLQQEEIIEGDNDGQIFSIPVDLIRIWLCQHTTPERIARDEFLTGE
ncbi:MAG TPA: ATP-binding protein, partial [Ktedonobacteraceae bacterium]